MATKFSLSVLSFFVSLILITSCSTKENPATDQSTHLLFPIKEKGKWGYMDEQGKIIVKPTFEYAWDFSNEMGRIRSNGKYGFVNVKGEIAVQPVFAYADDFLEEYVRVNTKDTVITGNYSFAPDIKSGWTFMNKKGVVFSETFAVAESVSNNTAAVKDEADYSIPYSYVTFSNDQLIRSERITEAIFNFNKHQLAPASDSETGKIGLIDKSEQWIVPASFDQVEPMSEGLAAAKKENLFGYIDGNGNWVFQQVVSVNDYVYLGSDFKPFSNGMAAVRFGKESYGFINKDGKPAFKNRFKSAGSFNKDGYAVVTTDAGTGLINTNGEFVIKPNLEIYSADNGVVIYKTAEGYGAKDLTGKDILKSIYSDVSLFGKTLKATERGATAGYINMAGNFVIEPQFDATWEFKNGKAIVNHKDKLVYIDKKGNIIGDVPEKESPYYYDRSNSIYAWTDETGKFVFTKAGDDAHPFSNKYDFATSFEGDIARINVGATYNEENYNYAGGKWGLIDQSGNAVMPASHELILPFNDGVAPYNSGGAAEYSLCDGECDQEVYYTCSGGKWGLINQEGQVVVEAKYDRLISFGNNYLAKNGTNIGLIDKTGAILYEEKLQLEIEDDYEGSIYSIRDHQFVKISENGKIGILDRTGKWLINPAYEDILVNSFYSDTPFNDGVAAIKIGGLWGAINASGNVVIEPAYEDMRSFKSGMAAIQQNGKWGFVTNDGKVVIAPVYYAVRDFQGNIAIVQQSEESPEAVIDANGTVRFQAEPGVILDHSGFEEGLCIISTNLVKEGAAYPETSSGVINAAGKVIFNVTASDEVRIQKDGLLYVRKNGKWAMATRDGQMLSSYDYDWIEPYDGQQLLRCNIGGEYALDEMEGSETYYGGLWGMLTPQGKLVIPMKFADIGEFKEGLAPARSNEDLDRIGYFDLNGNTLRPLTR